MPLKLNDVFSCEGIWTTEKNSDALIEHRSIMVFKIAIVGISRCRAVAQDRDSNVMTEWPRNTHDPNATFANGSGLGNYGIVLFWQICHAELVAKVGKLEWLA